MSTVPVLPATFVPTALRALALPSAAAVRSMSVSMQAVSADTALPFRLRRLIEYAAVA